MDSRAQFEAWYLRRYGKKDLNAVRYNVKNHAEFCDAWEVWHASRASIEVEPPKFIDSREALSMGRMVDYSNGFGDAMDAYEVSIKSVGISIKGESS